ncbi:MAG: alpha-glucan family phosphorylase [Saprospiraceae bacterium]|nr:alpha-glucan family phosphorylase [Saprospiraceae bacterium]
MKRRKQPTVAYFCMEYGLKSDFHIYAGGLGILAGDYLKGAKDNAYPLVGIGIKWKQGYTTQVLNDQGIPVDTYPIYHYDFLEDTGITVEVMIRKRPVFCKVWKCNQFGNADLYLLDTDLPENEDPWITGQLYGWFGEERIAQEMVLGIGGVRALRALKIPVDIYHFNEGHALLAGIELMSEKMDRGLSYEAAWQTTKKEIVFTTHTPVVQGNESHPLDRLMYMGANLNLKRNQLQKLGGSPFNMTVGALRLSKISNAVAQLHGITANQMWKDIKDRSEIIAITNGIHVPTWVDAKMLEAIDKSDSIIWKAHQQNKQKLINFIEKRKGVKLDKNKLLIGFSRRAVPYKRSDLIFSNLRIIGPLLKSGKVQLVFSGKGHPLDDTGKLIVQKLASMQKKYPNSVVFLENYDMEIGALLTRGADVWLNNPRRPKEASGTSGMKASMNGVLNLSILDGWWPEACQDGINGWQIGDESVPPTEAEQDDQDRKALYTVLLQKVIPTYYDDRKKWIEMMRSSILTTREEFSVDRMLDQYDHLMYRKN